MKKKLQVFVSSTYTDLRDERQAAVEAILRAGHIPAGMELFAAGSESQLEIIKRWIDDSDIYMLLLGARYGSVDQSSGFSYTEVEYRYALEKGKPVFAIILSDNFIDNKVKLEGKGILELAEPVKMKVFKELVQQKISRFAEEKSDIRLSVLESLLDIQSRYSLSGWIREDEVLDVSELLSQITDLKNQNAALTKQVNTIELKTPETIGDFSFGDLVEALTNVKLALNKEITGKEPVKTTLLDIFLYYKRALSTGVDNRVGSSVMNQYLYFTVCGHLRIYDLAELSKIDGVSYTRFQTSRLGNKFLALASIKGYKSNLTSKDGTITLRKDNPL